MTIRNNIIRIVFFTMLQFVFCCDISSQEILNITKIPHHVVGYKEANEIRTENGQYIVPIYGAEHNIYEYLPAMEVDSFAIPTYSSIFGNPVAVGASMYASYEPYVGFTDKVILNSQWENDDVHFDGDYASYISRKPYFGINDNYPYDLPQSEDEYISKQSRITVYNIKEDSFVYKHTFGQGSVYELTSAIRGDYIYVNIPLTYNYDDDLPFMGDTLIFPFESWGTSCNYVSKINFKTGEKSWTRHIGNGEVRQIHIDDQDRVNVDLVSAYPVVYEFESIHSLPDTTYGWYDRLIYRLSPDGDFLDDTYIHTWNDASVRKVDFNSDGSFQAIGYVNWPMTVFVEGDSLDFSDAISFDKNKGLVLVYDENMNYKWGKKIVTEGFTLPNAMNRTEEGDYILSTITDSQWIELDNISFVGPSIPNPDNIEGTFDQSILMRFDPMGSLLGQPLFGTHNNIINDIQTLGEHHFLIIIEKIGYNSFNFLDESDFSFNADDSYIVEYKGDVFDIMTTIDNYFVDRNISISPNPIQTDQKIRIELSGIANIEKIQLSLYSSIGDLIDYQDLKYQEKLDYRIPINISSGTYYISISIGNNKFSSPVIINN